MLKWRDSLAVVKLLISNAMLIYATILCYTGMLYAMLCYAELLIHKHDSLWWSCMISALMTGSSAL